MQTKEEYLYIYYVHMYIITACTVVQAVTVQAVVKANEPDTHNQNV